MKKLISILCAAAMLISTASFTSAAEKFEMETSASVGDYYVIDNGNGDAKIEDGLTIVTDTVNGNERQVLKVELQEGSKRDFGINFDDIADGNYRLTLTYHCTTNPGEARLGLRRADGTGKMSNTQKDIEQTEDYKTVTKNITISDPNNKDYQFARIRFNGGGTGYCYISEFKLQAISESDGKEILGDNILPEFYSERIKGTLEGWTLENNPITEDKAVIDYATVNGEYKPVVKWSYSNANKDFRYWIGGEGKEKESLPLGKYKISVTYYAPDETGEGKLSIRNCNGGGFPGNAPNVTLIKNDTYMTVEREIEVTDANAKQFLDLRCTNSKTVDMYISEVKLQQIQADGSLGANIIKNGDFMVRKSADTEPTAAPTTAPSLTPTAAPSSEPVTTPKPTSRPATTEKPTDFDGFETEMVTSLDGYYFIDNTNTSIDNGMTFVTDTVNGVERSVIRVELKEGKNRDFGINFDDVPDGNYRLTTTYYCPVDPGEGRFGLRRENKVNWPGNSPEGTIKQNEKYETVIKDITVSDNGNSAYQYARIRFNGNGGGNGYCYISEFKLQKIYESEDGTVTLGGNILPEFYGERIKGTLDGWQLMDSSDSMEIAYASIDGVNKPVIKWRYHQNGGSNLRYYLGGHNKEEKPLAAGNYRISITYYSPKNPGTGKIGIRRDQNGSFPNNNNDKTIIQNTEYTTVMRDVTVPDEEKNTKQYLNIACEYGDAADLYIAEVKLQLINADGSMGDNLIENGDFMVRKQSEPDNPDQFEANNLMFDILGEDGQSMTNNQGIDFFPPISDYPLGASVTVKNNSKKTINPCFVVALYYDGALYDVKYVTVPITGGNDADLAVYMSIPDSVAIEKLTAKAFVWESFENMKPITSYLEIK